MLAVYVNDDDEFEVACWHHLGGKGDSFWRRGYIANSSKNDVSLSAGRANNARSPKMAIGR